MNSLGRIARLFGFLRARRCAQPRFVADLLEPRRLLCAVPLTQPAGDELLPQQHEIPIISVTRHAKHASENGPTARPFTIWRSGGLDSALVVNFTIGGTATNGVDYGIIGNAITIPAGADHFRIWVRPVDDDVPEPTETVTLTLNPGSAYVVGESSAATVRIVDNDTIAIPPPLLNVTAPMGAASESGTARPFTITREGDLSRPLVVSFTVGGTATNGDDYGFIGNAITVPAGHSAFRIWVRPIDDDLVEGTETVTLTLNPSPLYAVGQNDSALIRILDNNVAVLPPPLVEVWAPSADASEAGPVSQSFIITRSGNTAEPLVVQFALGGTAVNGLDYGFLAETITIPAGQSQVSVTVNPVDDNLYEGTETVVLTLGASDAYTVASNSFATIRILDNDTDTRTTITWSTVAPSPIWRCEAQKGVIDGKLYVFGGMIEGMDGPVHRSDVYDPVTNKWTRIADLPTRVTHAATAVDGNKVWLAGGWVGWGPYLGQQHYGTTEVWIYDAETDTYSAGPSLPQPRGSGVMVKLGRNLHFIGGCDPQRIDRTDHWVLDLDNQAAGWKTSVPIPQARNHVGAAVVDDHIFLIGGQVGPDDDTGAKAEMWVWHPSWSAWKQLPDLPKARSHHNEATLVHEGRIIMIAGIPLGGGAMHDVNAYDPKTGKWTTLTSLPAARYTGVAAIIDDVIYYSTGAATTTYKGVLS